MANRSGAAVLDLIHSVWHRQTPDRAEQRVITRKIVEREFDQVWRMWMPYDNGFVVSQPHVRNTTSGALRRTDGYDSPMMARVWLDK